MKKVEVQEGGGRELVSGSRIAAMCGVSVRTVGRWRTSGFIPYVTLPGGGAFRFDPAAVKATLVEMEAADKIE